MIRYQRSFGKNSILQYKCLKFEHSYYSIFAILLMKLFSILAVTTLTFANAARIKIGGKWFQKKISWNQDNTSARTIYIPVDNNEKNQHTPGNKFAIPKKKAPIIYNFPNKNGAEQQNNNQKNNRKTNQLSYNDQNREQQRIYKKDSYDGQTNIANIVPALKFDQSASINTVNNQFTNQKQQDTEQQNNFGRPPSLAPLKRPSPIQNLSPFNEVDSPFSLGARGEQKPLVEDRRNNLSPSQSNVMEGEKNLIMGGQYNKIEGSQNTIGWGNFNRINGNSNVIQYGNNNLVKGDGAYIEGSNNLVHRG